MKGSNKKKILLRNWKKSSGHEFAVQPDNKMYQGEMKMKNSLISEIKQQTNVIFQNIPYHIGLMHSFIRDDTGKWPSFMGLSQFMQTTENTSR